MAKKNANEAPTSGAEAVRRYCKAHPGVKDADAIAAGVKKEFGKDVSKATVWNTRHKAKKDRTTRAAAKKSVTKKSTKSKRKTVRRKPGRKPKETTFTLKELTLAKKVLDEIGDPRKAHMALDTVQAVRE